MPVEDMMSFDKYIGVIQRKVISDIRRAFLMVEEPCSRTFHDTIRQKKWRKFS